MKFLSVRDLKTKSSQVWKDLPEQKEMVVTSNGRPIALLSSINENNLEQVLTAFRRARATMPWRQFNTIPFKMGLIGYPWMR